jgi:hypothetical protein
MVRAYNQPPKTNRPPEPTLDYPGFMEALLTVEGSMSDTYRRMTQYSMGNCALFMYQGIMPQPVATYKGWEAVDRHVVKGAKARWVLRPITVKSKYETNEAGEPLQFTRFKLVRAIFPIEDTTGEPLPKTELPHWSQEQADQTLGVSRIPFGAFDSNMQGYSIGHEYAINPIAKWPEKTHKHELGHIVLGHTAMTSFDDDNRPHQGIREFQAEGVAHFVMTELNLDDRFDPSESRAYIQNWLHDDTPSDEHIRGVFTGTDKILKAGRVEDDTAAAIAVLKEAGMLASDKYVRR